MLLLIDHAYPIAVGGSHMLCAVDQENLECVQS